MKGLKFLIVVVLIALTAYGWVNLAIEKSTEAVSYKSYIDVADQYVDEGLYQRAILKYKEAIAQNNSEKTWTKMLAAYELRYSEDTRILSDYITELKNALVLYPDNIDFVKKLYELHMISNDIENAYNCLNTAILNGVKDEAIIKQAKELKYSYDLNYNTYSSFKGLSNQIYAVSKGSEWGYISADGETIVDFQYPYASSLNEENIRICETTLGSRLLNGDDMVLGIFKFTVTDSEIYSDGLIPVFNEGKYNYYDSFAKEQFGGYEEAGTFQNGLAAVKKDGKYFLIDTSGEKASEKYADIVTDDNGRYLTGDVMVAAKKDGKYQLFDKEGQAVSNFTASNMDICTPDGLIAFEKDGKWGFVDTSGNIIIKPSYEQAKSFSCGLAAVCKDGKWGFINTSNEVVIDYQFAEADYFNSTGTCMVCSDNLNAEGDLLWQLLVLKLGL